MLAPLCHEACSDRIVQDVRDHPLDVFVGAEEVILEATLPEAADDAMIPCRSLRQVFELAHKRDDVAGWGRIEQQMDVVGHDAVSVNSDSCPVGMLAQHFHGGPCDIRSREDGPTILHRYRDGTEYARLCVA